MIGKGINISGAFTDKMNGIVQKQGSTLAKYYNHYFLDTRPRLPPR